MIAISIGICAAFKTHDYLGIRLEMLVLLVFGSISIIVWGILTLTFTGNDKRILFLLGFAVMSSVFCIISIYFPFFRYGIYERIKNKRDRSYSYTIGNKKATNREIQSLKIFASKKHFESLRKYAAGAFMIENIDFIVEMSHWRYEVLQALKQKGLLVLIEAPTHTHTK